MNYETYTLANNIRLIHLRTNSTVAHLGILMGTGSRDEKEHEHGMAHLIEHMLFKGTLKRRPYHIISRLEDVGGDVNAYTTKEDTCIYASFMKEDYSRTLELFYDILYHSTFPPRELHKEKEVIIDEINSYLDNPGELIFDEFEELLFSKHTIGRNILGSPSTLGKIATSDIIEFIRNNYATEEIVISSVGNISFNRLVKLVEKYFSAVEFKLRIRKRTGINRQVIPNITRQKNTFQVHAILGTTAYDIKDERRIDLHLLNNILGGPGMNSRLNMTLREKKGYSYQTESHYTPYSDTGVINIYFSCDRNKLERSSEVVFGELAKLRNTKLGSMQLSKAKRQLTGQLAMSLENYDSLMLSMAKSHMIFNKVDSLDEIKKKIDAVTATRILEIANEIFDESNLTSLIYI